MVTSVVAVIFDVVPLYRCLLTTAKSAETQRRPIQPYHPQKALDKACRLAEWQTKQNLQGQARPDRLIAEALLPTTLTVRWRAPDHLGVEPYR